MKRKTALMNLAIAIELIAEAVKDLAIAFESEQPETQPVSADTTIVYQGHRGKWDSQWQSMLKGNAVKVSRSGASALRQRTNKLPDHQRVSIHKLESDEYLVKIINKYPPPKD